MNPTPPPTPLPSPAEATVTWRATKGDPKSSMPIAGTESWGDVWEITKGEGVQGEFVAFAINQDDAKAIVRAVNSRAALESLLHDSIRVMEECTADTRAAFELMDSVFERYEALKEGALLDIIQADDRNAGFHAACNKARALLAPAAVAGEDGV